MAISGIGAAASAPPASGPLPQSSGHHRHGAHSRPISDLDAQSSSVASTASSTGGIGSKVNVTA